MARATGTDNGSRPRPQPNRPTPPRPAPRPNTTQPPSSRPAPPRPTNRATSAQRPIPRNSATQQQRPIPPQQRPPSRPPSRPPTPAPRYPNADRSEGRPTAPPRPQPSMQREMAPIQRHRAESRMANRERTPTASMQRDMRPRTPPARPISRAEQVTNQLEQRYRRAGGEPLDLSSYGDRIAAAESEYARNAGADGRNQRRMAEQDYRQDVSAWTQAERQRQALVNGRRADEAARPAPGPRRPTWQEDAKRILWDTPGEMIGAAGGALQEGAAAVFNAGMNMMRPGDAYGPGGVAGAIRNGRQPKPVDYLTEHADTLYNVSKYLPGSPTGYQDIAEQWNNPELAKRRREALQTPMDRATPEQLELRRDSGRSANPLELASMYLSMGAGVPGVANRLGRVGQAANYLDEIMDAPISAPARLARGAAAEAFESRVGPWMPRRLKDIRNMRDAEAFTEEMLAPPRPRVTRPTGSPVPAGKPDDVRLQAEVNQILEAAQAGRMTQEQAAELISAAYKRSGGNRAYTMPDAESIPAQPARRAPEAPADPRGARYGSSIPGGERFGVPGPRPGNRFVSGADMAKLGSRAPEQTPTTPARFDNGNVMTDAEHRQMVQKARFEEAQEQRYRDRNWTGPAVPTGARNPDGSKVMGRPTYTAQTIYEAEASGRITKQQADVALSKLQEWEAADTRRALDPRGLLGAQNVGAQMPEPRPDFGSRQGSPFLASRPMPADGNYAQGGMIPATSRPTSAMRLGPNGLFRANQTNIPRGDFDAGPLHPEYSRPIPEGMPGVSLPGGPIPTRSAQAPITGRPGQPMPSVTRPDYSADEELRRLMAATGETYPDQQTLGSNLASRPNTYEQRRAQTYAPGFEANGPTANQVLNAEEYGDVLHPWDNTAQEIEARRFADQHATNYRAEWGDVPAGYEPPEVGAEHVPAPINPAVAATPDNVLDLGDNPSKMQELYARVEQARQERWSNYQAQLDARGIPRTAREDLSSPIYDQYYGSWAAEVQGIMDAPQHTGFDGDQQAWRAQAELRALASELEASGRYQSTVDTYQEFLRQTPPDLLEQLADVGLTGGSVNFRGAGGERMSRYDRYGADQAFPKGETRDNTNRLWRDLEDMQNQVAKPMGPVENPAFGIFKRPLETLKRQLADPSAGPELNAWAKRFEQSERTERWLQDLANQVESKLNFRPGGTEAGIGTVQGQDLADWFDRLSPRDKAGWMRQYKLDEYASVEDIQAAVNKHLATVVLRPGYSGYNENNLALPPRGVPDAQLAMQSARSGVGYDPDTDVDATSFANPRADSPIDDSYAGGLPDAIGMGSRDKGPLEENYPSREQLQQMRYSASRRRERAELLDALTGAETPRQKALLLDRFYASKSPHVANLVAGKPRRFGKDGQVLEPTRMPRVVRGRQAGGSSYPDPMDPTGKRRVGGNTADVMRRGPLATENRSRFPLGDVRGDMQAVNRDWMERKAELEGMLQNHQYADPQAVRQMMQARSELQKLPANHPNRPALQERYNAAADIIRSERADIEGALSRMSTQLPARLRPAIEENGRLIDDMNTQAGRNRMTPEQVEALMQEFGPEVARFTRTPGGYRTNEAGKLERDWDTNSTAGGVESYNPKTKRNVPEVDQLLEEYRSLVQNRKPAPTDTAALVRAWDAPNRMDPYQVQALEAEYQAQHPDLFDDEGRFRPAMFEDLADMTSDQRRNYAKQLGDAGMGGKILQQVGSRARNMQSVRPTLRGNGDVNVANWRETFLDMLAGVQSSKYGISQVQKSDLSGNQLVGLLGELDQRQKSGALPSASQRLAGNAGYAAGQTRRTLNEFDAPRAPAPRGERYDVAPRTGRDAGGQARMNVLNELYPADPMTGMSSRVKPPTSRSAPTPEAQPTAADPLKGLLDLLGLDFNDNFDDSFGMGLGGLFRKRGAMPDRSAEIAAERAGDTTQNPRYADSPLGDRARAGARRAMSDADLYGDAPAAESQSATTPDEYGDPSMRVTEVPDSQVDLDDPAVRQALDDLFAEQPEVAQQAATNAGVTPPAAAPAPAGRQPLYDYDNPHPDYREDSTGTPWVKTDPRTNEKYWIDVDGSRQPMGGKKATRPSGTPTSQDGSDGAPKGRGFRMPSGRAVTLATAGIGLAGTAVALARDADRDIAQTRDQYANAAITSAQLLKDVQSRYPGLQMTPQQAYDAYTQDKLPRWWDMLPGEQQLPYNPLTGMGNVDELAQKLMAEQKLQEAQPGAQQTSSVRADLQQLANEYMMAETSQKQTLYDELMALAAANPEAAAGILLYNKDDIGPLSSAWQKRQSEGDPEADDGKGRGLTPEEAARADGKIMGPGGVYVKQPTYPGDTTLDPATQQLLESLDGTTWTESGTYLENGEWVDRGSPSGGGTKNGSGASSQSGRGNGGSTSSGAGSSGMAQSPVSDAFLKPGQYVGDWSRDPFTGDFIVWDGQQYVLPAPDGSGSGSGRSSGGSGGGGGGSQSGSNPQLGDYWAAPTGDDSAWRQNPETGEWAVWYNGSWVYPPEEGESASGGGGQSAPGSGKSGTGGSTSGGAADGGAMPDYWDPPKAGGSVWRQDPISGEWAAWYDYDQDGDQEWGLPADGGKTSYGGGSSGGGSGYGGGGGGYGGGSSGTSGSSGDLWAIPDAERMLVLRAIHGTGAWDGLDDLLKKYGLDRMTAIRQFVQQPQWKQMPSQPALSRYL